MGTEFLAIKIANILFEDRYGGPQKRVIQVAKSLRVKGVETTLVLPVGSGKAEVLARQSGIRVCRLNFARIPRPSDLARLLNWVACLPKDIVLFIRYFRRECPDIIHVNGAIFFLPAFAARMVHTPLVWHLNDTIIPAKVASILGFLVRLFAEKIVVAAEAVAKHYHVAAIPHYVLYAPVDIKKYHVSELWQRPKKGPARIGLIANWSPVKGIEYFVKAAAMVRDNLDKDLEVVFAGEKMASHSSYCKHIENLIENLNLTGLIHYYGFLPAVNNMLASLDVLVLSSTSEACPMVVLEAMASGVPVVATDVGGVRELLLKEEEKPCGTVVPPRDPEALADAILQLLNNPDETKRMGANSRKLAQEHFSLEECAKRHLELYTELVSEQKKH